MGNLNAEQIKKALECCSPSGKHCTECVYFYRAVDDICAPYLMADALALITSQEQRIKKLTEENERLKLADSIASVSVPEALRIINEYCESYIKRAEADTVRRMREALLEELYKVARCRHGDECNMKSPEVFSLIDKVAKEVLGE